MPGADELRGVLNPHRFYEPVSPRVLRPDSWWRVAWNVVVGVVALASAIYVPLDVAYDACDGLGIGLALAIDLLFACDLVLAFFTAYHDPALQPVTNLRLIRRRALLIDTCPGLCSSLPFELLDGAFYPSRNPLVLIKLMRLIKLSGAKRSLADAGVHPGLLRLIQMSLAYLLTVHCTSCLYWAIATRQVGATLDDLGCDPAVSPLVESWGVCPELREESALLFDQYFHSFYIAAVIMKGSNYPAPLETPSKIFTGVALLIGAVLQAGVIAAAASFLSNLDKHRLALRQRLDEVDAHLSHYKVDATLKKRVRSFFHYLFHCGHHTKEDELLNGLSEKLRMQILLARMSNLVQKGLIFRRISSACTLALVQQLVPIIVLPHEYVIVQGRKGHEMFFVARGLVQITVVHERVEHPVELLGEGAAFGEGELLDDGDATTVATSVLTLRFCELLQLSRSDFNWLIVTFSEFRQCIEKLRAERLEAIINRVMQVDEERFAPHDIGVHTRVACSPCRTPKEELSISADAPRMPAGATSPPAVANGQRAGRDSDLYRPANEQPYRSGSVRQRKVHPTPLEVNRDEPEHLAERIDRCQAPRRLRPPQSPGAVSRWLNQSAPGVSPSASHPEVGTELPTIFSSSPAPTKVSENPRLIRQDTDEDSCSPSSLASSYAAISAPSTSPNVSFRRRRASSNGLNSLRSVLAMHKSNHQGNDLIHALSESIDSPMSIHDYAPFRRCDPIRGSGAATPNPIRSRRASCCDNNGVGDVPAVVDEAYMVSPEARETSQREESEDGFKDIIKGVDGGG